MYVPSMLGPELSAAMLGTMRAVRTSSVAIAISVFTAFSFGISGSAKIHVAGFAGNRQDVPRVQKQLVSGLRRFAMRKSHISIVACVMVLAIGGMWVIAQEKQQRDAAEQAQKAQQAAQKAAESTK